MFELDSDNTPEQMVDSLNDEQQVKDDKEADALIKTKIGLDKIDSALPQVEGLEDDADIDKYATESFQTYKDLIDLGMNIEPRLAGRILEVASSMMQNAISAKNTKVDKKLKMIESFVK